jgi:hypothetical protein
MAKSDMKEDMKMDVAQDKAMIKKAFKQHDMQEHKGGKGTTLKLAKGGKTNANMKTMGRGMAKVANQKKSSFTYKRGG